VPRRANKAGLDSAYVGTDYTAAAAAGTGDIAVAAVDIEEPAAGVATVGNAATADTDTERGLVAVAAESEAGAGARLPAIAAAFAFAAVLPTAAFVPAEWQVGAVALAQPSASLAPVPAVADAPPAVSPPGQPVAGALRLSFSPRVTPAVVAVQPLASFPPQ